ncbi:MAG: lysine-2,3-aminomutase-like protein [Alsobacter sp.]
MNAPPFPRPYPGGPRVGRTLTTPQDLVSHGFAPPEALPGLEAVAGRYTVALTPALAALADAADPADPIARQFVPDARELVRLPEEREDPIGDEARSPVPGLVHRYPDRVLLKLAQVCAVYCRFCFRREMVGPGTRAMLAPAELEAALAYIRADPAIWEVIVTGGDPLVLAPRRLAETVAALDAIDHVRILRWHTRLPVAAPDRMTPELVAALTGTRKSVYVAVHANHPRELTRDMRAACDSLLAAGATLVSQTVLLRGVNDDVETLAALMRGFVEARIRPYYLHHADLAPGTAHWRVSLDEGRALVAALRGRVSGLCQPHYVLDLPGGYGKAPVGPDRLGADGRVQDHEGRWHAYPPQPDGD